MLPLLFKLLNLYLLQIYFEKPFNLDTSGKKNVQQTHSIIPNFVHVLLLKGALWK